MLNLAQRPTTYNRLLPFGGTAEDYRLAILRTFPKLFQQCLGDPELTDVEALSEAANHARSMLLCLKHGVETAL